jgi:hypothetical protein
MTSVPRSFIILGRTMFIMWLVKTLIYPPSTIDIMAHQRYAEEVDAATLAAESWT